MTDLIEDWKTRNASRQKEQRKFIVRLKREKTAPLNKLAEQVHEEVFSELSCMSCANCCSTIPPIVNRTDASRIAKYLGMKSAQFQAEYLHKDEDGDMVMKTTPCTFLESNNSCRIYEVRPKACQRYPYTDDFEFADHIDLHYQNVAYCPAVFHIIERLSKVEKIDAPRIK